MKHILVFSFSLFAVASLHAQKKQAAKPAAATTTSQQPVNQKSTAATQTVYMVNGSPEEYKKFASDARSSYDAGKLDDSRFAMQQMMAELDMITGKEMLKVLPANLLDKAAVTKLDNVSGASGFVGVVVHREYGKDYSNNTSGEEAKNITVEIISNSPMIAGLNSLLSIPLIGNSGDNKVIKVAGYKALMTKSSGSNNETDYELQLPMGSSLITVRAPGATQDQVAQIAGSLPIQDMAKMLQ